MKKAMVSLSLVMMLAFMLNSLPSVAQTPGTPAVTVGQEDKVKIKKEELPEAARKTLSGDAFKGWTIGEVYKTKAGEYEVEMRKDETVQVVKFDKAGKVK